MPLLALFIVFALTNVQSQHVTGNNFIMVKKSVSYASAKAYCAKTFGTTLASVHSASENAEAGKLCANSGSAKVCSFGHVMYPCCWLGLNDIAKEKTWVWEDKSRVDYTKWAPGEPNYGGEDCVEMFPSIGKSLVNVWNNKVCSYKRYFLCNKPQVKQVTGNNFIMVTKSVNYASAKAYCANTFKTTLASIHSASEDAEAKKLCQANAKFCLIGLTDLKAAKKWVWDDGSRVDYKGWAPGQPNNGGEDCTVLFVGDSYKWHDWSCKISRYFLCNKPTPSPTPAPTPAPSPAPSPSPTPSPTPAPTPAPSPAPSPAPTPAPSPSPTARPSDNPTSRCDLLDIDHYLADCSDEFVANEADIDSLKKETDLLKSGLTNLGQKVEKSNENVSGQLTKLSAQINGKAAVKDVSALQSKVAQKADLKDVKTDFSAFGRRLEAVEEHLSHFVKASAHQFEPNVDGYNVASPNQNLVIGALVVLNVATVIGCIACLCMKMKAKKEVVVYDGVQQQE